MTGTEYADWLRDAVTIWRLMYGDDCPVPALLTAASTAYLPDDSFRCVLARAAAAAYQTSRTAEETLAASCFMQAALSFDDGKSASSVPQMLIHLLSLQSGDTAKRICNVLENAWAERYIRTAEEQYEHSNGHSVSQGRR